MMVQLYKKGEVWIGLKYNIISHYFSWMDGSQVVYTNWYNGFPDPRAGDYVKVSADQHGVEKFMFWHVANKNETHPFFCRKLKGIEFDVSN